MDILNLDNKKKKKKMFVQKLKIHDPTTKKY